ncbi:endonuclease/exonuclease/phosphatase family protein [Flavobacterium sp. DGU11]|uniref:Endonuclease/exonuclease/phosphatase family protein n=1 Tax=Flavobacterium arundinis TaxID=3139143 RepID=A0ABU9HXM0_9FLAO
MKIATWNTERLKYHKQLEAIIKMLESIDADILVLTESDTRIVLSKKYKYSASTLKPNDAGLLKYAETERRVQVFSKYEIVNVFETYDPYTTCCAEIKTSLGNLQVYGTIIGVFGNREKSFRTDLATQAKDFRRLSANGNFCLAGDYNMTFSDNYYFTQQGRNILDEVFKETGIINCTAGLPEAVDHIAISKFFLKDTSYKTQEFNTDKKLSDHKGVCINI